MKAVAFFLGGEDAIRDRGRSRGPGYVYEKQAVGRSRGHQQVGIREDTARAVRPKPHLLVAPGTAQSRLWAVPGVTSRWGFGKTRREPFARIPTCW